MTLGDGGPCDFSEKFCQGLLIDRQRQIPRQGGVRAHGHVACGGPHHPYQRSRQHGHRRAPTHTAQREGGMVSRDSRATEGAAAGPQREQQRSTPAAHRQGHRGFSRRTTEGLAFSLTVFT